MQWIGIDISPAAVALMRNRLRKICDLGKTTDVIGMPTSIEELKTYRPFDFQYWVINELHGTPSLKKVGDMGIDGLSFLRHHLIQVKQSESVGRNVIDNFETALRRYYKHKTKGLVGYVIAFSFTRGAHEEVARAKKDGFRIDLITVKQLLERRTPAHAAKDLYTGERSESVESDHGEPPDEQQCLGSDEPESGQKQRGPQSARRARARRV